MTFSKRWKVWFTKHFTMTQIYLPWQNRFRLCMQTSPLHQSSPCLKDVCTILVICSASLTLPWYYFHAFFHCWLGYQYFSSKQGFVSVVYLGWRHSGSMPVVFPDLQQVLVWGWIFGPFLVEVPGCLISSVRKVFKVC